VGNSSDHTDVLDKDMRPEMLSLWENVRAAVPTLEDILAGTDEEWWSENLIYRFYHQSYKVYRLQDLTMKIVLALQWLAPVRELNEWFLTIVREETGKRFTYSDNARWLEAPRPILEAFFHARYFLGMLIKYGREIEHPPFSLPSGYAAILYLYGLR